MHNIVTNTNWKGTEARTARLNHDGFPESSSGSPPPSLPLVICSSTWYFSLKQKILWQSVGNQNISEYISYQYNLTYGCTQTGSHYFFGRQISVTRSKSLLSIWKYPFCNRKNIVKARTYMGDDFFALRLKRNFTEFHGGFTK